MADFPANWSPDEIKVIVNFCHGINPDEPKRCDHYEVGRLCSITGKLQWGKGISQYCDVAVHGGVAGSLDEYGFLPHRERK